MKRILLGLAVLAAVSSSSAWALESSNLNLTLEDGSASLTCRLASGSLSAGLLIDADGTGGSSFACTNAIPTGITMDAASMTSGTLAPARVVSSCANGYYLRMNSGGTALECANVTSGTSFPQMFSVSSETRLGASGASSSRSAYMGLNGKLTQSVNNADGVSTPIATATTFSNLRCKLDNAVAGTSSSMTVTLIGGVCSQFGTWQTQNTALQVTLNTNDTGTQTDSDTVSFTAPTGTAGSTVANCVAFRVNSTNTTSTPFVNCTVEKTA